MPQVLPMTRVEAYLAYKAGVISEADLKPSLKTNFYSGLEHWLAFWCGLCEDYPVDENNDPKWYTEEEYYVAYLCGIAPDYPVNCYRRVGAYLRHIISYRWPEPEKPLTREEYYLSLIDSTTTSNLTPSSNFTLNDTTDGVFQGVEVYGDTFQQTYTGKNLWGGLPSDVAQNSVGVNWVNKKDGTIEIVNSGTTTETSFSLTSAGARNNNHYITLVAGTYCVSNGTDQAAVQVARADNGAVLASTAGVPSFTLTTTTDVFVRATIPTGETFSSGAIAPQIEVGSTPTSYEPYVGGIPAPSPDYPQDINVVTGEQTVTVTGKNLWASSWEQGNIRSDTGENEPSPDSVRCKDFVPVKAGVSYAINRSISTSFVTVRCYDADKQYLGSGTNNIRYISGATNGTATNPMIAGGSYCVISPKDGVAYIKFVDRSNNLATQYMMVEGDTQAAYEPYQGQSYHLSLDSLELCKIGDYQDYIRKSTGKNLFDKSNNSYIINGYLNGMSLSISSSVTSSIAYIPCRPNTTYTVSKIAGARFAIGTTTSIPEVGTGLLQYSRNDSVTALTITTGDTAKYLVVWPYNSSVDTGTLEEMLSTVQIELGPTDTEYEPYGEVWYKHKVVAKIVCDGTEDDWQTSTYDGSNRQFYIPLSGAATESDVRANALSTHFRRRNTGDGIFFISGSAQLVIRQPLSGGSLIASDVPTWKTWLSTHNVTVYYILAAAAAETITDASLVAQLEALAAGQSYDPLTNFIVTATDPNLPALLKITAYKKQ